MIGATDTINGPLDRGEDGPFNPSDRPELRVLIATLIGLYVVVGVPVALVFLAGPVEQAVDPPAAVSPLTRVLLLPGAVLLWPLVVMRWRARRKLT